MTSQDRSVKAEIERLISHVGCGDLDAMGECETCIQIRRFLSALIAEAPSQHAPTCNREVMRHADDSAAYLSEPCTCGMASPRSAPATAAPQKPLWVKGAERLKKCFEERLWGHALFCNYSTTTGAFCNCGAAQILAALKEYSAPATAEGVCE